ncbi:uncharacterized protein LODBEIA_P17160 [Lodderomyces beijingensis]|uniref:UBR-type domain-containing protein n=1 Tax=Lodderomyces beijingensis TaxID=1775926 RepID=A0ABP0ZJ76_9ASCO
MSSYTTDAPGGSNGNNSSKDEDPVTTAVHYIQEQAELSKQARELMPYEPDQCTYEMGELRQSVYACLTCSRENNNTPIGVCYSCSIHCHSQHELVELFTKRAFVCDCGTTRMSKTANGACKLRRQNNNNSKEKGKGAASSSSCSPSSSRHASQVELPADDIPSSTNTYNQNFHGKFCGCQSFYNPLEETGNMIQCYFGFSCGEDWFHDQCIMGFAPDTFKTRNDAESDKNRRIGENMLDELSPPGFGADQADDHDNDNDHDNDEENKGNADNAMKVVGAKTMDQPEHKEKLHNAQEQQAKEEKEEGSTKAERDQLDVDDQEMIRKLKYFPQLSSFDSYLCWQCVQKFTQVFDELEKRIPGVVASKLPRFEGVKTVDEWHRLSQQQQQNNNAPSPPPLKKMKLENDQNENGPRRKQQSMSIFLANDFKHKIKETLPQLDANSKLVQFLKNNPYLYDEDPIYQPPIDSSEEEWSTTVSYLDMGAADAIHSLPRDQAIETIKGYDKMRAKLRDFFKPFAEQGKVVTEEEVKSFFGQINDDDKKLARGE